MAEGTRSQDQRRFEESIQNTLREILAKIHVQETNITALGVQQTALGVQQGQLMARFQNDQNETVSPGSGQGGNTQVGETHGRGQYFATRQAKVDFPQFSGEDLSGWLYKCQQFFEVDNTPPESRVRLAAINLNGRALQWHQNWVKYKRGGEVVTWDAYVKALEDRFGDQRTGDPMAELLSLTQTGTVANYHDQFEFLLGRVDLTEEYAVSFYLNGLKKVIQQPVRMFMPKTLHQAYALASSKKPL